MLVGHNLKLTARQEGCEVPKGADTKDRPGPHTLSFREWFSEEQQQPACNVSRVRFAWGQMKGLT